MYNFYNLISLPGTANTVNERDGGYEHITVARELGPPDLELLQFIHGEITPGMCLLGTFWQLLS